MKILDCQSAFVSPRTGIVRQVQRISAHCGEPSALHWYLAVPSASEEVLGYRALNRGSAVSIDEKRARAKALGECIERYCAAFVVSDKLVLASESQLESSVQLNKFSLYSDEQMDVDAFPFSRYSSDLLISWYPAVEMTTRSPAWVPASFVFVPYGRHFDHEAFLDHQISSGLACAETAERARLKGLLEVLERDAFMRAWRTQKIGPSVDLSTLRDQTAIASLQELKASGWNVTVVHIGERWAAPIFLAFATPTGNRPPHFVCGCGTGISTESGILSALEELALGILGIGRRIREGFSWQPDNDFKNVKTIDQHGMAYAVNSNLATAATAIFASGARVSIDDLTAFSHNSDRHALDDLTTRLQRENISCYECDLTTQDVAQLGLFVFRVIVPGSVPLDQDASWQHPIFTMNYDGCGEKLRVPTTNQLPHPFP